MSWTDDITIKKLTRFQKRIIAGNEMKAIMIITAGSFISKHFA
ncbi:hypothetical protein BSBH6_01337 [Bacillus subtilis]|nr:hypothetical protein BSBH6_01337 [Bacillus subtilis]RPK18427.1 hypothetical protein BH5_01334 [Bacillus subtilis]